ncbi:MAG: HigA family addiction module antitoxin [Xylella fastidiosa subsp. multiplex]
MSKTLPPIHPGEILREEFMVPLGLSSNALAKAIGVTAARINEIVRERPPHSPRRNSPGGVYGPSRSVQ